MDAKNIRVAEEFDDDGYAIYTTTLRLVLSRFQETDTFKYDIELQRLSADASEDTGLDVVSGESYEQMELGTAFIHSELIEELSPVELGVSPEELRTVSDIPSENAMYPYALHAADVFWRALPSEQQRQCPVDWLVKYYFEEC